MKYQSACVRCCLILATLYFLCNGCRVKVTRKVYMDLEYKKRFLGRLVFGLFDEFSPNTVWVFHRLATRGYFGVAFKGSWVGFIDKDQYIQMGVVLCNNGTKELSFNWNWNNPEVGANVTDIRNYRNYIVYRYSSSASDYCCQFVISKNLTYSDDKDKILMIGMILKGDKALKKIFNVPVDSKLVPKDHIVVKRSGNFGVDPYSLSSSSHLESLIYFTSIVFVLILLRR